MSLNESFVIECCTVTDPVELNNYRATQNKLGEILLLLCMIAPLITLGIIFTYQLYLFQDIISRSQ